MYECDFDTCDYETCEQCNPEYSKKKEERETYISINRSKENNAFNTFKELLKKNTTITLKAKLFSFYGYLDHPYDEHNDCSITFDSSDNYNNYIGILRKKDQLTIIYSDDSQFDKKTSIFEFDSQFESIFEFPTYCSYLFDDNENNEPKRLGTRLNFIFSDVIFEDYVHQGYGFFIEIDEINRIARELL